MGELLISLRKLVRRDSAHLIIVLDEVDHMLRRSGDDLLYQLLRIDEDQSGKGTLSLIIISQEQVLDLLETAVISRMGSTNHIMIPPYTVDGIEQIVNQRAEYSLVGGTFSPNIIRIIAEKAGPSGDARRGIELLSAAVERCEFRQDAQSAREILVEDIHEPNDGVALKIRVELEVVDDLSAHQMLVLLALCRRLKTEETMSMGDVESLYAVVCEEYEQKQKSHTTIWKYIKYLEQQQLIDSKVSNVSGGRGRTTHLSMPYHLPADLSSRLELLLPKRLRS
tara:strand:- start:921 stop:1763 length:843 start_codon:yes stop_codon:yes gene_type:complete